MASMFGRASPCPLAPSYTPSEVAAVAAREAAERDAGALVTEEDRAWAAAVAPAAARAAGGALALPRCAARWWQTPVSVTVALRLPPGAGKVAVRIERGSVRVVAGATILLAAAPRRALAPALSTWTLCDGVLSLTLVKASRRGRYADGETAADTWWRALLAEGGAGEGRGALGGAGAGALTTASLLPPNPPVEYYALPDDAGDDCVRWRGRRG